MAGQKRRAGSRKTVPARTRGKPLRKTAARRAAAKAKRAAKTPRARKTTARRGGSRARKPATQKQREAPRQRELPIEGAIIDVIEEPVPGVLVVSEIEAVRVTVPDSDAAAEDRSKR